MKTPKDTSKNESEIVPTNGKKTVAGTTAIPTPCVYCGPSVRGVARQYTVFTGKLPEGVEELLKAHPSARGLIVGTASFAKMRVALETPGTRENLLFNKIKSELS